MFKNCSDVTMNDFGNEGKNSLAFHILIICPVILSENKRSTQKKEAKCSLCSYVPVSFIDLRKHNLYAHTCSTVYKCDLCTKSFMQSSDLKRHMIVHTRERPHHCSLCAKAFSQKASLQRHLLSHTGERPHQCSYCGKSFSRKHYLITHTLLHTVERPHRCTFCGKLFKDINSLHVHLKDHAS